jgi:hypothetical protein
MITDPNLIARSEDEFNAMNSLETILDGIKDDQEAFWNNLSKDDQLKAFCSVVRRLVDGELEQNGTYRYVLYNVFGFGKEAYMQAQHAGFLALHNSLAGGDNYDAHLLRAFCQKNNIENAEEKILNWIL